MFAAPLALAAMSGTAVTTGTLLAVGLGGLSSYAQFQKGRTENEMAKAQARQADVNARLETVKGKQEGLAIKEQRDRTIASINATFAARGGSTNSGSPLTAMRISENNAANALDTSNFNSSMRSLSDRNRASTLRAEGKSAQQIGFIKAVTNDPSKSFSSLLGV
jgi:hypothetical protein